MFLLSSVDLGIFIQLERNEPTLDNFAVFCQILRKFLPLWDSRCASAEVSLAGCSWPIWPLSSNSACVESDASTARSPRHRQRVINFSSLCYLL